MKRWIQDMRRRRAIARLRRELAFWGINLDQIDDEQLEQGVLEIAKVSAACGVTTAEAIAALDKLRVAGTVSADGAAESMRAFHRAITNEGK